MFSAVQRGRQGSSFLPAGQQQGSAKLRSGPSSCQLGFVGQQSWDVVFVQPAVQQRVGEEQKGSKFSVFRVQVVLDGGAKI